MLPPLLSLLLLAPFWLVFISPRMKPETFLQPRSSRREMFHQSSDHCTFPHLPVRQTAFSLVLSILICSQNGQLGGDWDLRYFQGIHQLAALHGNVYEDNNMRLLPSFSTSCYEGKWNPFHLLKVYMHTQIFQYFRGGVCLFFT